MYSKAHFRYVEAFKHVAGQELETNQIAAIMLDKFKTPREGVRPNNHAEGTKGGYGCAHTDKRILDRIGHGLYRVRPISRQEGES